MAAACSRPANFRDFLLASDGVTELIDKLKPLKIRHYLSRLTVTWPRVVFILVFVVEVLLAPLENKKMHFSCGILALHLDALLCFGLRHLASRFGKEDTAKELQDHAADTQDTLVDAVENAEVAEIKRAVFRALTRLRAATIKEFDTIARLETQAIDACA